jgi:tetratricopeptide (TPR) repeat protein
MRFDGVPADQRVESPWGSFRLDVTHSPDAPHRLEVVFQTRLTRTRVEPSEFDAFRGFQQAVVAGHAAPLKLKPSTVLADAAPMEAVLALAPGDATTATTLARIYLANGRTADARRVLERTRRFAPDERPVWECSLPAAADLDEEEELYREMVERFPDVWNYKLDLAHNLLDQQKPGEARKILEPLTRHADGAVSVPALVALARCCLDQAEPRAALRHLKAARDAHPDRFDAEAWLIQGEAHEAMGRADEALAAYRTALEKEPDAADLLEALVRVTVATGKRDEALGYLRRFVAAVGEDAEGLARAADGYARVGRFDDAFELASRAKAPDGSTPDLAHAPLGLALAHRGEFAPALKNLSIVPLDASVLAARIRCRLALGDVAGAVEDAERERAVDDSTPELRRLVSDVRSVEKRFQDLRPAATGPAWERFVCAEYLHSRNEWPGRVSELLTEALAGDNRPGPALALRAVLHLEGGRLARALADAEQAITLSPQEYRGYLARGRVRYERGSAGALADLEKAAELSRRQDATVLHTLAAALAQAGRNGDALATQRAAVQLAPNNAEFRQQLQELETKK